MIIAERATLKSPRFHDRQPSEIAEESPQRKLGSRLLKRSLDVGLALLISVIVLPLLAIVAILLRLEGRGPVFYGQSRLGRRGEPFTAWKFRSMVADADEILESFLLANPAAREEWERDHKLKHDPRITWLGRILRSTSLDELPQIWNVLRGDMSLVGPRPIVRAEIVKYGEVYEDYMQVWPGITGLWQVSGRNNTTYEERVRLDRDYVRNWSLSKDLLILIRTVRVVLLREGAY